MPVIGSTRCYTCESAARSNSDLEDGARESFLVNRITWFKHTQPKGPSTANWLACTVAGCDTNTLIPAGADLLLQDTSSRRMHTNTNWLLHRLNSRAAPKHSTTVRSKHSSEPQSQIILARHVLGGKANTHRRTNTRAKTDSRQLTLLVRYTHSTHL